ncbi:MAG: Fic family protein [Candidatus Omnitrophica bacterium]|nr:Fic family protein [Candidatus Omnitrophota bacterium]
MNSFRKVGKNIQLPLSAVWMMNTVSEYKGKEELFAKQSPQILNALVEMAMIESVESSNRIEGVTIERKRLKPIVIGHSKPRDRSEEELSGYRKALDLIHKKYESLAISSETIKELHRLSRLDVGDAGQWKKKNNEIIKKHPNGRIEIVFTPLEADKVSDAIKQLCLAYEDSLAQSSYPPLYAIACLILDFLSIHPFRDGNGRVSRLLTLLALYQNGYGVGKYISLERIVEQSKEAYYESLNKSSQDWHKSKHDVMPWVHYFLSAIVSAYREFEQRAGHLKPARGAKTQIISQVILNQLGEFSISDIEQECPGVSRDMIRVVFRQLQDEKKIICLGKGKSAKWKKK